MDQVSIFCKTYRNDLSRAQKLLESITKHNRDNLKVILSVPSEDFILFKSNGFPDDVLVCDEDFVVSDSYHQHPGWVQQQIVKLSCFNLGRASNYLIVDSDSWFIRDFSVDDFIAEKDYSIPYTIMHEGKDFFEQVPLFNLPFNPKESYLKDRLTVIDVFKRKEPNRVWDFGPTPVIWNSKVLSYLCDMDSFDKLIRIVPSELTWYGEAVLDYGLPLYPIQPLFKCFHYKQQWDIAEQVGYTEEHYKENYLGIVKQSNWQ